MSKQDFVKQVEELCLHNDNVNNSVEISNTIQEAMKENGDTVLVDLIANDPLSDSSGALNITFYAYSEKHIYFLEKLIIPYSDGETEAFIVSIPRHPTPEEATFYFGGYS